MLAGLGWIFQEFPAGILDQVQWIWHDQQRRGISELSKLGLIALEPLVNKLTRVQQLLLFLCIFDQTVWETRLAENRMLKKFNPADTLIRVPLQQSDQ